MRISNLDSLQTTALHLLGIGSKLVNLTYNPIKATPAAKKTKNGDSKPLITP